MANVFVRFDMPMFKAMVARAEKCQDDREWRKDERGIHVPLTWLGK